MRSLWIFVLVVCLPLFSAKPLESNVTAASLTPKPQQNEAPVARSYPGINTADSENEEPEDESEGEDDIQPEEEEEEPAAYPEANSDESGGENQEEEYNEDETASQTPYQPIDDKQKANEKESRKVDLQYKMRGVVYSSLGYAYYIGQKILVLNAKKGIYEKGRVIDFTASGIRLYMDNGKRYIVLQNWKTQLIPLEVPSTCSIFRNMNVLVWKKNKYSLARITTASYIVRLDRGETTSFLSKSLRPMRVRLCEAVKTKGIKSRNVLVRDQTSGGYWTPGRVYRQWRNHKYVILVYKTRQQITIKNKNNNIIENKQPTMRQITVGSRILANTRGAYRPGTVIGIKYNYVLKKTNKKGIVKPENIVITPTQPWYVAFRIRPRRGGSNGISSLIPRQKIVVIKNNRGLIGQVDKVIISRDGRKTVTIKIIIPTSRRKEFTKGISVWVSIRGTNYAAKVITVGPRTTYVVILIKTQGPARPSRLWKYIKKTLTSLATKTKGYRLYGYHKCFNYFGSVLRNVPQNNMRSTRYRMVDILFKTVGRGGTRNVPGKNKGVSVKFLGRYYEGMVVKKDLMTFVARFRVSTTVNIKTLQKVDRLRKTFQRRIAKLDKTGFILWVKIRSRNYPSLKVVSFNPNQRGVYVNYRITRGSLRQSKRISVKFGSMTSSATVTRTVGQFAYIRAYVPRNALRIAYGKEIDRIRDDVFNSVIRTRALTCGGGEIYGGGGIGSSTILGGRGNYVRAITRWLRKSRQRSGNWKRCFSTKKHGWSSHRFHKECDNKGPSITIVQVGSNIFGGYSSVAWRTNAGYIKSNKNFLFSLRNSMNKPPFKIPAKSSGNHAIYSNNGYGPTFGGGHDLYIVNGHGSNSYSNLGHSYVASGYRYGSSQIKKVLAGKYRFQVTNYEVFVHKPKPGGGFRTSRIIGKYGRYVKYLERWLAAASHGGSTWRNCYRASEDKWLSSTFHRKCNDKGATLTLIKTSNGNIFGGFNPKSWSSSSRYVRSTNSFLFSLRNKAGLRPFRMMMRPTRQKYSSYNNNNYGVTFGGGHDLYIANNAGNTMSSYSNLGHSYFPPKGFKYGASKTKNIFAGRYKFKPVEVEVFFG